MKINNVRLNEITGTVAILFSTQSTWVEAKALEVSRLAGRLTIVLDRLIEQPEKVESSDWTISGSYVSVISHAIVESEIFLEPNT